MSEANSTTRTSSGQTRCLKEGDIIDSRGRLLTAEARSRMGGATRIKPTHGMRNTVEYATWNSMISRCHVPSSSSYDSHGARGIVVCDRWRYSFENFYADMGQRPEGTSLDRIDNDGNYTPENCRWATRIQQQRNKRDNRIIEFNGERMCLQEAAEKYGLRRDTLARRLKRGWTLEEALHLPLLRGKKTRVQKLRILEAATNSRAPAGGTDGRQDVL